MIIFTFTFRNGSTATASVRPRKARGKDRHCGSAHVIFKGDFPNRDREKKKDPESHHEWEEFLVALAAPMGVNPFSGRFCYGGPSNRDDLGRETADFIADIYWKQERFHKKSAAVWKATHPTVVTTPP
jgi:hypothetical protein